MKQLLQINFVVFILVAFATVSLANNFEDGLQAYAVGDLKKAYQLWLIEAEKGTPTAQNNLGFMLENGQGVAQSYKEAVKWYRMAAEQGYADAHLNLGVLYFEGRGILQSYEDAYACWVVAAANGVEIALKNMEIGQRQMTPNQIKRGQQIAKQVWARPSN